MKFRRKGRPPTRGGWTKESSAKAHAAKARKRMEPSCDGEPRRVPDREPLCVLQLHEASGQVRRWIVRQGPRANNIRVRAKGREVVCGWDKFMRLLRKKLSAPKRLLP